MQIYLYICFFFCTFVAQMGNIIQYIIEFLVYGNLEAANAVGYTSNESDWDKYRVVILPNGQLGKKIVEPDLCEVAIEARENGQGWLIRTDIIYNTFFFISRAEELINPQRDSHGRFLAQYSILGKNNRLMIPTVDEYARLLMKLLGLPLPTPSFSHVYLTHDIDSIANYRHLRGAIGGIIRGQWRSVLASQRDIHNDPAFTFSWLIKQDKKVLNAQCIYFTKDTRGKGYDYPQYNLDSNDFAVVKQLINNSGAQLAWHGSYYGDEAKRLIDEKLLHRSHYLRCSMFVRRAGGLLPPNIIKLDFRLRKSTEIIHFSLFDIHYSSNIQCSVRDPATACRASRSTPLRSAQDDTDGVFDGLISQKM